MVRLTGHSRALDIRSVVLPASRIGAGEGGVTELDEEREAALGFLDVRGVGPATLRRLGERYGCLAEAAKQQRKLQPGLLRREAQADYEAQMDLSARACDVRARLARLGARVVFPGEPDWPQPLERLREAMPAVLFVWGTWPLQGRPVSVVGTRRADSSGLAWTRRLAEELVQAGAAVLSGGALGIDTAAHQGALDGEGRTWAVLGSGFEVLYPKENVPLFQRMREAGGGLLSELPPRHEVKPGNFPRRNQLVAALSEALVVVQGAMDSGAMLTVGDALGLGRPVLAMPGDLKDPLAEGPNAVLRARSGHACLGADDVLATLGLQPPWRLPPSGQPQQAGLFGLVTSAPPARVQVEPALQPLLESLGHRPRHLDELAAALSLGPAALALALMQLELQGAIEQRPGKWFVRR